MDSERTRNKPGKPRGARGHEPHRAAHWFLLLEALLMLSAAAAAIAIGMPQALPVAPDYAYAFAAVFTDSDPTDNGDRALEGVEEQHQPLITDDLRSEGVKYALAGANRAIGC